MIQVHKKQPDRITTTKFNDNNTSQWTTFLDGKTSCLKIRLVKIKTKNNICFVWVFGSTIKWRITAEWGRVNMICYFIPNRQAWKSGKCEMKKKYWLEIAFFLNVNPSGRWNAILDVVSLYSCSSIYFQSQPTKQLFI